MSLMWLAFDPRIQSETGSLVSVRGRRQADVREFESCLVYLENSRTVWTSQ